MDEESQYWIFVPYPICGIKKGSDLMECLPVTKYDGGMEAVIVPHLMNGQSLHLDLEWASDETIAEHEVSLIIAHGDNGFEEKHIMKGKPTEILISKDQKHVCFVERNKKDEEGRTILIPCVAGAEDGHVRLSVRSKKVTSGKDSQETNVENKSDATSISPDSALRGDELEQDQRASKQSFEEALEKEFQLNRFLSRRRRIEIASNLCLTEEKVKWWFSNRHMTWEKQQQNVVPPPIPQVTLAPDPRHLPHDRESVSNVAAGSTSETGRQNDEVQASPKNESCIEPQKDESANATTKTDSTGKHDDESHRNTFQFSVTIPSYGQLFSKLAQMFARVKGIRLPKLGFTPLLVVFCLIYISLMFGAHEDFGWKNITLTNDIPTFMHGRDSIQIFVANKRITDWQCKQVTVQRKLTENKDTDTDIVCYGHTELV
jgi:hypothetical protein